MARAFAAGVLGLGLGAQAQSLTNCGGSSDILSNPVFTVSPDPPRKGSPLTITVTGSLKEELSALTLRSDLELKALGLITENVNESTQITLSPSFPAGPVSITVGPMTLPSLPGVLAGKGRLQAVSASQTPFFCADVALELSSESLAAETQLAATPACPSGEASLITDVFSSTAADGTETLGFTLDKDMSGIVVKADLKAKALFLSIPLSLTVPISVSPAVAAGPWVLTSKDLTSASLAAAASPVSISGIIDITDANGEEMYCFPIEATEVGAIATRTTVVAECPEMTCVKSSCASQVSACEKDSSCASALGCLSACGCDDEACGNACVAGATITPAVLSVVLCAQQNCGASSVATSLVGATATGACSADDQSKLSDAQIVGDKQNACGTSALGVFNLDHDKFVSCVQADLGISESCGECYYTVANYGFKNCKFACLSGWCKSGCLSCTQPAQDALGTCAGFTTSTANPCDSEVAQVELV